MPVKIAAAYIRVSTEDQTEYSPDSQIKLIREYAARSGYLVPDEYVYEDAGISGRTAAKRPAFLRMIAAAKEKPSPFEAILVWKFSRFARNQEESIVYKSMLKKQCSVDVISVSEPIGDDMFGSLIERIIEWMDQFYSIRLSGEVKRGMAEKVSRGEPVVRPPFGYSMVESRYVPDEHAPVVRQMFSDYAAGVPMIAIARGLNSRGFRTIRGNGFDNRGVEYILRNPVYIGKVRWSKDGRTVSVREYYSKNEIVRDGLHEPIVSQELWDAVQQRLAEQRRTHTRNAQQVPASFSLRGLLRCDACGSTLVRSTPANVQCARYNRGQCSVSHSISIAKAEQLVIEGLRETVKAGSITLDPKAPKISASSGVDYARLIAAEERKLSRAQDAFLSDAITVEDLKRMRAQIESQIESLRAAQAQETASAHTQPSTTIARIVEVLAVMESPDATPAAKNDALRSVISRIVYNKPDGTLDIFYLP